MDARTMNDLPPAATHDGVVRCPMAIELSKKSWIIAVNTPLSDKISNYTVKDWNGLRELIDKIRTRVGRELKQPVEIVSCYEPAMTGFGSIGCWNRPACAITSSTRRASRLIGAPDA